MKIVENYVHCTVVDNNAAIYGNWYLGWSKGGMHVDTTVSCHVTENRFQSQENDAVPYPQFKCFFIRNAEKIKKKRSG